jgi:hypothetical protein
MKMKSKLLAIIAIAVLSAPLSNAVAAETPKWFLDAIKVDNPNELAVLAVPNEECPITKAELNKIVSGVLIRSRVKPLTGDAWYQNSLYLKVKLGCLRKSETTRSQGYSLNINFGNALVKQMYLYTYDYGSLGPQGKAGMTSVIKQHVEAAITDFIKANFDL